MSAVPIASSTPADTLRALGAQLFVRGWLSANNVLFPDSGEQGAAVVDSGYVSHGAQTLALLEHALGERPLARILNTHLHSDHCGGNAALLRRWPRARLSVPLGYAPHVRPWNAQALGFHAMDQRYEPFEVHGFLAPGNTVRLGPHDWEIHATPGHDPDAVVLFEPVTRTLISGDALWEQRLAIIFPELVGESGFEEAQRALDLIERLAPRLVLPGHGEAFTDVAAALSASRRRLDAFMAAPDRHHQYATRALVTYHLMAQRALPREALQHWITQTPVLRRAPGEHASAEDVKRFAEETVQRLIADGVVVEEGGVVRMAG
ncbi:MBL fold metallo-hydrolase [Azohydromonas caseinilytica]|uniref:MBL fold metallo-hydrolase n=1 Tax=Azohydromonas caseinilytica TaxID=2728836 RepID=A0A848F4F0_9BURK|nr:MBL fold metallo-hydrolase [Azohydromonas caseinilytica]NML13958.1 MBL fold metallo-hydrolase [Azohydromonas caseinilytica]